MPKSIKINAFTGMNNIKDSEGLFVQKGGVAEPRVVLNADVTEKGRLVKRDGYTQVVALTAPHSLWALGDTCILCVAQGALYRIVGGGAVSIGAVTDNNSPMGYAAVGGKVYYANRYCNGIFDPEAGTMSDWGITLPNGPMLSATNGNLDSGTYHVCLTTEADGEISGNGPIMQIALAAVGGISISNRGSNDIVWCTDPNGDIFYRVGKTDTIVNVPTVEPLPSLFCYPPPYLQFLTHAFGRMWGARDNILYYSEPFHPEWWKRATAWFQFPTDITMIAKMRTGLFVGCEDRTYCMLGTDPEEMQQIDAGSGTILGTLAYVDGIVHLGDAISPPEKTHHGIPVWMTREEGIVVGNQEGRLFSLTKGKVRFNPGGSGASLYRNKNGHFQYLTSVPQGGAESSVGIGDEATITVIRNGRVI